MQIVQLHTIVLCLYSSMLDLMFLTQTRLCFHHAAQKCNRHCFRLPLMVVDTGGDCNRWDHNEGLANPSAFSVTILPRKKAKAWLLLVNGWEMIKVRLCGDMFGAVMPFPCDVHCLLIGRACKYSVSGGGSLLLYRTRFCILDRHDQSANRLKNNNTKRHKETAPLPPAPLARKTWNAIKQNLSGLNVEVFY